MCVPGFSGKYRERKFDLETYSIFISKPDHSNKVPKQTKDTGNSYSLPKAKQTKNTGDTNRLLKQTKNTGYPNILPKQTTQTDCLNQLPKQLPKQQIT